MCVYVCMCVFVWFVLYSMSVCVHALAAGWDYPGVVFFIRHTDPVVSVTFPLTETPFTHEARWMGKRGRECVCVCVCVCVSVCVCVC